MVFYGIHSKFGDLVVKVIRKREYLLETHSNFPGQNVETRGPIYGINEVCKRSYFYLTRIVTNANLPGRNPLSSFMAWIAASIPSLYSTYHTQTFPTSVRCGAADRHYAKVNQYRATRFVMEDVPRLNVVVYDITLCEICEGAGRVS